MAPFSSQLCLLSRSSCYVNGYLQINLERKHFFMVLFPYNSIEKKHRQVQDYDSIPFQTVVKHLFTKAVNPFLYKLFYAISLFLKTVFRVPRQVVVMKYISSPTKKSHLTSRESCRAHLHHRPLTHQSDRL